MSMKKQSGDDQNAPDTITDTEIKTFNRAVRENYRLAVKEIREANKNKAKRKTFKYDLGEDTDSDENENGLYGLHDVNLDVSQTSEKKYPQKELYHFMVLGENKIQRSKAILSKFGFQRFLWLFWTFQVDWSSNFSRQREKSVECNLQ